MNIDGNIRSLTESDKLPVIQLIAQHLLDEENISTPSDEIAVADFKAINADLDRHLGGDPTIYFTVAISDGHVVGVAAISVSFMARPEVWELGWQTVHPDYRLRGIGAALIGRCEVHARKRGGEIFLLASGEPEHHKRCGYRVVAESRETSLMVKTETPD